MASTIKIKRSQGTSNAAAVAGELQWTDQDAAGNGGAAGILYIGDAKTGGSVIREIGGPGWLPPLAAPLASPQLTGAPTAPTVTTGGAGQDSSTKIATTAFVQAAVSGATPDMNAISDTSLSHATDCPDASFLIWDTVTNKWEDQRISGHVSVDKDGNSSITSYPAGSINMSTDTDGNYVKSIGMPTGVNNEVLVTTNSGTGADGDTVEIRLQEDVVIRGNLTVAGTTTSVDSTTVSIADPIFKLGSGADAAVAACDRGIEVGYVDSGAKLGFFGMDTTDKRFKYMTAATNTGDTYSGTAGDAEFGNIYGTLKTVAQNDITHATSLANVGTILTGVWNGTAIPATHGGTGLDTSQGANQSGVVTVNGAGAYVVDKNGLDVANGGTGLASYTAGDLMYATGATVLGKLPKGTAGQFLQMNSGATAPEWTSTLDGGSF